VFDSIRLVPWWGQADMQFKDKFFACLSLGDRTYRTDKSDKCVLFASATFEIRQQNN